MKLKLIFSIIFSVIIFISALVYFKGVNHNTDIFMGYERMVDLVCIVFFFISSIVFLRRGIEKVKSAENY
jgi:uncharacterized membrane protein